MDLLVDVHYFMVMVIGEKHDYSNSLRPIVSINLKTSGYSLTKNENEKNEISFSLVKNSK